MKDNVDLQREPGTLENRRPKVLFFDYWTLGSFHFTELMKAAQPGAAEYRLLHLGSFRNPATPASEVVNGLHCIDVSSFPGRRLDQILRLLDPDVVVGLNMTGICDRALFLTCRQLGIPTVFVQHGAWLDSEVFKAQLKANDRNYTLFDRLSRVPKYLRTLPWYLRACGIKSWPQAARVVIRTFRFPASSHFLPTTPDELWPDLAITYNFGSADWLKSHFQLPAERIRVIGNPELDPAFARRENPLAPERLRELARMAGLDASRPIICFLEDAFVEQSFMMGWTEELRVKHVADLAGACKRAGVQLLVRPHPVSKVEGMRKAVEGRSDVSITRDLNLVDTIDLSAVVVGTVSTALETAIVLQKPVLTPLWYIGGKPSNSPFLEGGGAASVADLGSLVESIRMSVAGQLGAKPAQSFIEARFGSAQGQAARRIIHTILSVASAAGQKHAE